MVIDGAKEYTTYRLDQQYLDLKKKSTDHNVIVLKIDFYTEIIQKKNAK